MAPTTIAGRYAVERAVGQGGMGTVWLCRDEVLGRSVAVKEVGSLPGTSTSDLARALREARSSAALNHRNVVSIYDAVEDGDQHWLVMEYVPSRTLSELVANEGPLSPERVVWIGAQAADGLAAAHERGTMHRDVKPGNILVTDDDHVKIMDFGIARTHGDAQLTRSGIVTGTPAYFAPELAKGAEPTVAADVWALGASLYAAVEGRLPYPGQTNAIALLTQIASGPPAPPERAAFLAESIARMMDPDPSTRWTMSDVAHTLHRLHDRHGTRGPGPATVTFAVPLAAEAAPVEATPDHAPQGDGGPATEATPGPTPQGDGGPATEATPGPTPETVPDAEPTTRPAPASSAGAATSSDPEQFDDREDRGAGGGRRVGIAAVVLLVALAAVGALMLNNRNDGSTPAADEPESSATTEAGGSGDEGAGEPDDQASPAPDQAASSEPGQFVEAYYSLLPGDTETAWALLSPSMQDQVGGYGTYTGFWGTITEVRVDGTTVVEEGVVDVELTYTSDRGTESETRRLQLEPTGESYLISGDQTV